MIILNIILIINVLLLFIYVAYHIFFLIGYPYIRWCCRSHKEKSGALEYARFAIVVPAHNEELIIEKLIKSYFRINYPKEKYELIVIADNCTDKTEEIVRSYNLKCLVRNDKENRGKPKALEWAFRHIDLKDFDAFTIIDADTEIDPDYLAAMNLRLGDGQKAIQGYFGIMNPDDTWLTRLSVLPGVIKFRTRYYCKDKLGISCPLMGNGMCFSADIIRKYGWNTFSITENWEYYIQLLKENIVVSYCEKAKIYSHAVRRLNHGVTQRRRWQKGRLLLLKKYFKTLIMMNIRTRDLNHLDALFELSGPSYSMLLNWSICSMLICLMASSIFHMHIFYLILSIIIFIALVVFFLFGMIIAKPTWKVWISILCLPVFLVWKIIITVLTIRSIGGAEWEKTERKI